MMFETSLGSLVFLFVLSFVLGAFVGLQKDVIHPSRKHLFSKNEQGDDFAGIRSFGLIALLWAVMQYIDSLVWSGIIFTLFGFLLVVILVNIDYIFHVFKKEKHSPASEIATLLVYFSWVLVFLGMQEIAIILTVWLATIVGTKDIIHNSLQKISREEILTTLKFAAIAFVILPLLPSEKYSFQSLFEALWISQASMIDFAFWTTPFFNPYSIWLFVVVMSAISFIWYILTRILWSTSGILVSSLMGWMISSTAVTASMSEESKKYPHNSSLYTTWALLASWVMFLRVMAIIAFVASGLLWAIFFPLILMFGTYIALTLYFFFTSKQDPNSVSHIEEKVKSPFRLAPALKFAAFIVMIKFIAALGIAYEGAIPQQVFYYGLGLISGLADVDAITQTMSSNAASWELALLLAGTTIIIAVISNNLVKGTLAYRFWETMFGRKVLATFVISGIVGLVSIFVM